MIKGIISHDFEGSLEEIRISESNAVLVIAAKQTEESLIGTEYCIQNISLADRMSRRDAVTILAKMCIRDRFGPLTASANTDAAYWSWINDPWPWEGGCY